jgi:topoisomerase-4 subunit B
LVKSSFKAGTKVEVSRFKGLGEMPPSALKETTMDPKKRTLLKVVALVEERAETDRVVESLMGRKPELRFQFIQENARSVEEVDV